MVVASAAGVLHPLSAALQAGMSWQCTRHSVPFSAGRHRTSAHGVSRSSAGFRAAARQGPLSGLSVRYTPEGTWHCKGDNQRARLQSPNLQAEPDAAADRLPLANVVDYNMEGVESSGSDSDTVKGPLMTVTRPLPRVLLLHTGGTLGMDPEASFAPNVEGTVVLREGTGGTYQGGLKPALAGMLLKNLLRVVPELTAFANLELKVVFNLDSSRVGPHEWQQLAHILHENRLKYDAFLVVHGTDTMAYTASALSLMLAGFKKPIIITGSQLPLLEPRSDARQNLIDSITCATASFTPPHVHLEEVAVCFGGNLMRGNRCRKVNSSSYQAFDSPDYPHLATLGVGVDWNRRFLLPVVGVYRPRFNLNSNVLRVPIVPGSDPRLVYGDCAERGVKGIVLEAFGVGNMPDAEHHGWLPWLKDQRSKGVKIYLTSQTARGGVQPELYQSGSVALALGVEAGPQMTPECSIVKMMHHLCYPDLPLGVPLAGEM